MSIRVAITDDHPLAIEGIVSILRDYAHIQISGTYQSGNALLEGLSLAQPDVLLLDIMLPDQSGKTLAAIIKERYPAVEIIALTSLDTPSMVSSMMRKGSKGYLLKNVDRNTLIDAIEKVYAGEEFIQPSLKEKLFDSLIHHTQQQEKIIPVITRREQQILELVAMEYTTQQIAEKLFISFRTVENHRYNLLQKFEVKSSLGLIKVATSIGLLK